MPQWLMDIIIAVAGILIGYFGEHVIHRSKK